MNCSRSRESSATLSIHSSEDGESYSEDNSLLEKLTDHIHQQQLSNGEVTVNDLFCIECHDYILPEEYLLIAGVSSLSPSILAACNPDPRVLHKVLNHGYALYQERLSRIVECFRETIAQNIQLDDCLLDISKEFSHQSIRIAGGVSTPLLAAIRSRLPINVKALLAAGADPNGAPIEFLSDYAAPFLRFGPQVSNSVNVQGGFASSDNIWSLMDHEQFSSQRRHGGIAPFWCDKVFTPTNLCANGWQSHSLVAAAYSGSIEIFDCLVVSGAELSHWIGNPDLEFRIEKHSANSLSICSPLHAAILASDMDMLHHLLDLNFNPNFMASATPTCYYTPLMATLISQSSFNKEAFNILVSHPKINIYLRTPVYKVHVLHLAVARLELDTLIHVATQIPLYTAGITALSHNLLHIACLPANARQIQSRSFMIRGSIHETRDLSSMNPHLETVAPEMVAENSPDTKDFVAQIEVVKWLFSNWMDNKLGCQDIHGNTPLHYLASYTIPNTKLVHWMKTQPGAMEIWKCCQNFAGATPELLMREIPKIHYHSSYYDGQRWMNSLG